MKKLIMLLLAMVISVAILSACDITRYPENGVYICEEPYYEFYFMEYGTPGNSKLEYNGEIIYADYLFRGNNGYISHIDDGADIYFATWHLNNKGDMVMKRYLPDDHSKSGYIDTLVLKRQEPNEHINMLNKGYVAVSADKMYYVEKDGLYKSNLNGTNKVKLQDGNIENINVVCDKIYYIMSEFVSQAKSKNIYFHTTNLYSCNLDGSDNKMLIENCSNVLVTHKKIYYTNKATLNSGAVPEINNLYMYDLSTKKTTKLVDKQVEQYQVVLDSDLYYKELNGNLYHINLVTVEQEESLIYRDQDNSVTGFTVKDDFIVIDSEHDILKYDLKKDKVKSIAKQKSINDCSIVIDEFIYYISSENTVCRLNYKSDKTEQLLDLNTQEDNNLNHYFLYAFGDKVYLYNNNDYSIVLL